jgi:ATP-dependent metalloprotease FtsH
MSAHAAAAMQGMGLRPPGVGSGSAASTGSARTTAKALSWRRAAPGGGVARPRRHDGDADAPESTRGDSLVAHGSIRPRGITDEQWEQQLREQNPNYRHFSQRAKERIAKRGPMIGDMRRERLGEKNATLEMIGRHPDRKEPSWRKMKMEGTGRMTTDMADRNVTLFEIWDPPQRPEKQVLPDTFLEVPRARRYVVTLKDGTKYWVDACNEQIDRAMRNHADEHSVWYTFHMKPAVNKMQSIQYLGSAIGGFVFLTGSIYLGIKRKHAIPTDAIQAMEFAQSRSDARKDAQVDVTLEDVGGLENIVEDLNEVIAFLKNPEKFKRLGAKPPKGLLMEGGPGVGKTLIAKAIAGEAQVPFYSMSGAEFVEIIVGVGAARIRDLFKRARMNAPCLIFVDEIDALGTRRAAAGTKGTEEHEQTLNQLLTEMDGFTPDTGVVFVGATNRADLLDPALMRPGRFDRKVTVPQPGIDARAKILQIHLAKRNVDPEIDTLQFAKNLPGLSGAELANICNEAAAISVRRGADLIETDDVMEAVDRVTNGLRHPLFDKDDETVHRLTRHELGHAIVASVLYKSTGLIEAVERVSIIPRGRDPTQTSYNRKRDEDYMFPTRARLLERVQVLMAGRAAEEVFYGNDITEYSFADIRDANDLTRNVVVNYGLGAPDMLTTYTYDPDTLWTPEKTIQTRKSRVASTGEMDRHDYNRKIHGYGHQADFDHYQYAERKILQILNEAMANAKAVIEAHRDAFEVAFDELIADDVLSGERLEEILAANPPSGDFPRKGPDTPCKTLKSEAEEAKEGTRVTGNKREKIEYAVKNYYPQITVEPENLRDRNEGLPRPGKDYKDLTLGDYVSTRKPQVERERLVPIEPWGVQAIKENLEEDPDWLAKQMIIAMREADKERLEELKTTLIPNLEAKVERAKSGATELVDSKGGTVIKSAIDDKFANMSEEEIEKYKAEKWDDWMSLEGGTYQRNAAQQKYVGKDGLTDRERRQLTRYNEEIEEIADRWTAAGEPTFDLSDDERMVPKLWRGDLSMSEELIELKSTLDTIEGVEGRMAYDMLQRVRAGFAAGGYVRTWDGFFYKEEECVKTPRGEWCRPKDLAKEEKHFQGKMGRDYDWLFNIDFKGM